MHIHHFSSEQDALTRAAQYLNEILRVTKKPVLLLLSGGSSLKLLSAIQPEVLGDHITISVLDERFSLDPTVNNWAQVKATEFYTQAVSRVCRFIDTTVTDNHSQEQLAEYFDHALKTWVEKHPNGKIIATIGIGPDGHISGMMPYPEDHHLFRTLFEQKEKWVAAYNAGDKNQFPLRVTTTMPFLRKINKAIVFITGESKQEALNRVVADKGKLHETPARILHKLKDAAMFTNISITSGRD